MSAREIKFFVGGIVGAIIAGLAVNYLWDRIKSNA